MLAQRQCQSSPSFEKACILQHAISTISIKLMHFWDMLFFFASNHIFHSFNVFLCLMAEERYRTIMKPPTHTTRELSWFRRHGHRHWCHRYAGKTLGSLHKSMWQHLAAMLFYQSFLHAGVIRVAVFTGTTAIVSLAPHPGYPLHGCMPRLPHLVWNPNMQ